MIPIFGTVPGNRRAVRQLEKIYGYKSKKSKTEYWQETGLADLDLGGRVCGRCPGDSLFCVQVCEREYRNYRYP